MDPWELHAWFGDYLDAVNRHDLDAVRDLLDPAVRRAHLPGGAEAWLDDLDRLFRAFPDWKWRRIQLVAEEDRIAVHLRGGGTHTGTFQGIAPTRRHANIAEFWFLRVVDRRVIESSGSGDAELLRQLA